jgi:soluble lytic murein transglycosylase
LSQEKPSVFPLGARGAAVSFFSFILCVLVSCKGNAVTDPPQDALAANLKNGVIDFIIEADLATVREIAKANPSAAFYAGLLVRTWEQNSSARDDVQEQTAEQAEQAEKAEKISRSLALFEAALESPVSRIQEEAARELLVPVLEKEIPAAALLTRLRTLTKTNNKEEENERIAKDNPLTHLEAAALYRLNRFHDALFVLGIRQEESAWYQALTVLSKLALDPGPKQKQETLDFLLNGSPNEAYVWTFREIRTRGLSLFSPGESTAIMGRFAVSHSAYWEGLRYFQLTLALEQDRLLFLTYPELTSDLGRCFQYTGAQSQKEGLSLFLEWNNLLKISGGGSAVRFRLLFFLGRIERQRENYTQSTVYFKDALLFAPDAAQEDACIWYILNTTWLNKREDLLPAVYRYCARWHDPSYFVDILDLLCCYLASNRQWKAMLEIFSRIRFMADGATTAKYAYILGRTLSENYISASEAAAALSALDMRDIDSEADRKTLLTRIFFRIAFEEADASFYYRALSAAHLGDQVLAGSQEEDRSADLLHKDEMALLLGFFEFGAAAYAVPYFKRVQEDLTVPELRILAENLAKKEQWIESIRLVSAYISREGYELDRFDMNLYYPRAFMDIIEKNAKETRIPPEILYGLIRTESAFDPTIKSHAGAVGLSQLMPGTAREQAGRIKRQGGPDYLENLDLKDPAINVHIGASYLSYLLNLMKSPMQALLSYNGGYGRVRSWRAKEPNLPEDLFLETIELIETREYGKRVLAAAAAYGYLYFDLTMETVAANIFSQR